MGLMVDVFRASEHYDCTNKGISSKAHYLCLVNVEGPFNPDQSRPAAMLVKGNGPGLVKIVPAMPDGNRIGHWIPRPEWCMMGGNYASTSDGRFHEAVRRIIGAQSYGAVPIHDRIE